MHIIWKGQTCFQIIASRGKEGNVEIVIDPFSETVGLRGLKLQADILVMTSDRSEELDAKQVQGNPFLISGPGEYEVKEVFVQGVSVVSETEGKGSNKSVIYTIETEGIKLCHLGELNQKELNSAQLEKIGDIDILMVPVGGGNALDSKQAQKIISQIEPRVVIPMYYQLPKLKTKLEDVDKFLKTVGKKSTEPQPKLLIKKKDLPEEGMDIVVLQP